QIGLEGLRIFIEVEQHQNEKEQHHNRSHVDDEIDHCEKLRIQEDIVYRKGKKRNNEVKYTVHRVLGEDGHQRKEDRQKGHKIKNAHATLVRVISGLGRGFMFFLIVKPGLHQFVFTVNKILAEIVGRYMR